MITGSSSDEIKGSKSDNANIAFDYYFSNSLINSVEEKSERLVNITWTKEANFKNIDKENYKYDFRPDSLCKAKDIGNLEIARNYPYDLNGRNRLQDGKPDAGCYEWMPGDK